MNPAFDPQLAADIETAGIVAVLVVDDAGDAVPLARGLLAGGVNAIELALRTPAALDALRGDQGTRSRGRCRCRNHPDCRASRAGRSRQAGPLEWPPGLNPRVLAAAREAGLSFAPGVLTPSDIELAVEHGCKLLKFFPAEPSGGLAYLKAIAAPYAHLGAQVCLRWEDSMPKTWPPISQTRPSPPWAVRGWHPAS